MGAAPAREDAAGSRATGRFVTLEGGEGAGKSTLLSALARWAAGRGHEVVVTREPGGTPGAEAVRALLLDESAGWDPLAEALLIGAARRDHVVTVVAPALARGAWVLCDRFVDSTMAYQGVLGGLDRARLAALQRWICGGVWPDATFVLDVDPGIGLARQTVVTRFEARERAFHDALRAAFLEIAAAEPRRCIVLDAGRPAEDVAATAARALAARWAES